MTTHYVTATDITPTRCTITGSYTRRDEAEAAVEKDDLAKVLEAESALAVGLRAYLLDGKAWGRDADGIDETDDLPAGEVLSRWTSANEAEHVVVERNATQEQWHRDPAVGAEWRQSESDKYCSLCGGA